MDAPKLARRPNPKVKTGCITCKKRRVKCDEKRPKCLRCIKTGRICDGYAQLDRDYFVQVFSHAQARSGRLERTVPTVSLYGDNVHCLEFYFHCVRPMLSGRFDTQFWSRIALQLAHAEPSVRNALIALSHLSKCEPGTLEHARRSTATKDPSQLKPFWYSYNNAVKCLVNRIAEPSYTPEVGLVSCILFVCIEFLRTDSHTAFTHLKNGLRIVSELRRERRTDLGTRQEGSAQHRFGASTSMIEEELVPILIQGLMSALMYGVDVDTEFTFLEHQPSCNYKQRFYDIREALSSYWDLRNASVLLARDMAMKLHQGVRPTKSDLQRRDYILQDHCTWLQALLELESFSNASTDERVSFSALKLAYYSTYTACACVTDTHEMSFDAHLSTFEALILHAKVIVKSMGITNVADPLRSRKDAVANFTFDTALIPALYHTALHCRCPTTRREAVTLLSLNIPREGLWDAQQHCIVAKRVIEIEEMEVDERGWPTEQARLSSSIVGLDLDKDGMFRADFLFAKDLGARTDKGWSERFALAEDQV
ncbi:hypothetical protein BKA66DRAFT_460063 [Pyrenochaeta sp. MPI-SDFR-AT-0127]|nr:hypothetical protein BKA66DRAFT_460063 [Pyrenochaeta sp. MPI-SDFR-AT-0127]